MWIMYEDENNVKRYINMDKVESIEITEMDIIFFLRGNSYHTAERIPKDSPAYETVRNYLENRFEYYGISQGAGQKTI